MRRGIPAKPKKCWGKNVKFTPIKVKKKCIFPAIRLISTPRKRGNQKYIPAIIEKAAPIDKT